MKVKFEIDTSTPARVQRALSRVGDVTQANGPGARIAVDGQDRPLTILPRPHRAIALTDEVRSLAQQVPRGAVGLVVADMIPRDERDAIEQVGLSWCDGRGAVHVAWPGVLIHIDRTAPRPAAGRDHGNLRLGPVGIRAVQVLLGDNDDDAWTTSRLARQAAISMGQAHNVLLALEQNRLVQSAGSGPRRHRIVMDRRAALDWLAVIDRARRRPKAAAAYLYARTIDDLLNLLAERAETAGLPYAVTAAAGAHILGLPVVSSIPVVHVRVSGIDVTDALERLSIDHLDAGRGANLELWADTGELGTFRATEIHGVRVAPPIRIWLDLARLGGRHEDAAQLFREQTLDRA